MIEEKEAAARSIQEIPEPELIQDLQDSRNDIGTCEAALRFGITEYSGGSVQRRIDVNKKIVSAITVELARRGRREEQS